MLHLFLKRYLPQHLAQPRSSLFTLTRDQFGNSLNVQTTNLLVNTQQYGESYEENETKKTAKTGLFCGRQKTVLQKIAIRINYKPVS